MARRFKRKRRSRRPRRKSSFGRSGAPMARKYAAVMNYQDEFLLNADTGAAVQVFSANGLFDPNISAGGHQPRGFDQIMPMYDHYVCVGSTIRCTFVNSSDSPLYVGISVRDSATVTSVANNYMEGHTVRYVIIPPALGGNAPVRTVSMKLNPNKFLSRSHPLSDAELKGSVSANPAEQCYYHVFTESLDGTNPDPIPVSAALTYSAMFIEPKQVTQS